MAKSGNIFCIAIYLYIYHSTDYYINYTNITNVMTRTNFLVAFTYELYFYKFGTRSGCF